MDTDALVADLKGYPSVSVLGENEGNLYSSRLIRAVRIVRGQLVVSRAYGYHPDMRWSCAPRGACRPAPSAHVSAAAMTGVAPNTEPQTERRAESRNRLYPECGWRKRTTSVFATASCHVRFC